MTAYKLMLLGEIGVGKTSLIRRMVRGSFEHEYKPTFGVDLYRVPIDAGPSGANHVELIVWDTDGNFGQTMFRHVYIKGASGALIIGDVMRRPTLETMVALAEGFQDALPGRHFGFVANKSDLVSDAAMLQLPEKLTSARHPLIITSAKSGSNVEEAFNHAAASIVRREQ